MISKILFICTGNICRSPMAEGYFQHLMSAADLDISVSSAGTATWSGSPPSDGSVLVMKNLGIDISAQRSTTLSSYVVDEADLIVCMSRGHLYDLNWNFPTASAKARTLLGERDVFDPIGGGFELYQQCFESMKVGLDKLFEELKTSDK